MPADFRSLSLVAPGGAGTKVVEDTVIFSGPVARADTALKSLIVDYSDSDHHINVLEATSSVASITGNAVRVRVRFQFADMNFDDAYAARADVLVIAA